ncbi:hypothetical protein PHJA_001986900 [Phtheirospermum japonicum]|uniref:Uncharacterized protein n=1 Tax=Phtheirospermum japonicum TaxID=374723 RepID=A0A830CFK4_9LAMI|nr:hypothetical protein PHJA_001986900 [Phtheirospermum japonicum]
MKFDGVNVVNKEEVLAELDKLQTGYQNSRFAHQVERFACLYTSQVSNLSLYSPDKYYRPGEDFMPHEFDILSL